MKVWERRLMKDFHVAASPGDEQESLQPPPAGENNVSRWKRIAKLAVLRSANHRWSQVSLLEQRFSSFVGLLVTDN